MSKKRIFAVLLSVLVFAGVVGASLANAGSGPTPAPAVVQDADNVDHECPPDCNAEDKADEATEAPGTEDAAEAEEAEAAEGNETPGTEEAGDTHEDTGDADHECPPDCDTANGETP